MAYCVAMYPLNSKGLGVLVGPADGDGKEGLSLILMQNIVERPWLWPGNAV